MLTKFIDVERLIHSIKTVIACLLGLLLTKVISLPTDQWVVITIIVVMCAQIYVGSVLQKAYLRFLGTIIGCIFAALAIIIGGGNNLTSAIAIGLSSFIFSYLATGQESLSYLGTLGAVTTAIILLGQNPTLLLALQRFLEISLGLFIATIVSQYVLPIQASTHLRRSQAKTLEQLRDYYAEAMINHRTEKENFDYHELDENIVKSLLKQRQLAKESSRERLGGFDPEHFSQFLYSEREMLRAITFMHYALVHIDNIASKFTQLPTAHAFNETILQTLTTLIKAVESHETLDEHIHIPSLKGIKEELENNIEAATNEDLMYIDGFLFSAEILTNNLSKLANLYRMPIFEAETAQPKSLAG